MSEVLINVLGTTYTVKRTLRANDTILNDNDGYCDDTTKTIVIEDMIPDELSKGDLNHYANKVTRHEIIHAFLSESGLQSSCDWATNETMIDFFAIQFPKMVAAMDEANCL